MKTSQKIKNKYLWKQVYLSLLVGLTCVVLSLDVAYAGLGCQAKFIVQDSKYGDNILKSRGLTSQVWTTMYACNKLTNFTHKASAKNPKYRQGATGVSGRSLKNMPTSLGQCGGDNLIKSDNTSKTASGATTGTVILGCKKWHFSDGITAILGENPELNDIFRFWSRLVADKAAQQACFGTYYGPNPLTNPNVVKDNCNYDFEADELERFGLNDKLDLPYFDDYADCVQENGKTSMARELERQKVKDQLSEQENKDYVQKNWELKSAGALACATAAKKARIAIEGSSTSSNIGASSSQINPPGPVISQPAPQVSTPAPKTTIKPKVSLTSTNSRASLLQSCLSQYRKHRSIFEYRKCVKK